MERLNVLRNLSFGSRVAEEEAEKLKHYFVKTDIWYQLLAGNIDIVYGPKGSGKSALYSLLTSNDDGLFDQGVLLTAAENPRGATAFRGITADPPASELEFVGLWKLYISALLHDVLAEYDIKNAHAVKLGEILRSEGLAKGSLNLGQLLSRAFLYIKQHFRPGAVETTVTIDPITQMPTVGGKIIFSPLDKSSSIDPILVDSLLELANSALIESGFKVWILLDRLDIAFSEHEDLESNALRALFRVYLDLMSYEHIQIKIFLRTDIWSRITSEGFREASHITKHLTIKWSDSALLNLIIKRAVHNVAIREYYSVGLDILDAPFADQKALFYRMFPQQVEVGPNKPTTFDWMVSRTKDGLGVSAPRELIHYLNKLRELQTQKLEIGDNALEDKKLFARTTFKAALPEVSQVRLEQTIYAEYPQYKVSLEKLRGAKTLQTVRSLEAIWGVSTEEAFRIATALVGIGFFEEKGSRSAPEYWVPFLYRPGLDFSQGTEDTGD
jgi:hypothetical protein